MKLIEKIPQKLLDATNEFAKDLEWARRVPIYEVHKWWARRLGSVFRAILLSSIEEESISPDVIWHKFCEGSKDKKDIIILDPFMGGGTTVVEAVRLGLKVIGVDINPIAFFVTKKEIEPLDMKGFEEVLIKLEETAGSFIKKYYITKCQKGHTADVIYFFWIKTLNCPRCSKEIKLFPDYVLLDKENKKIVVCPKCLNLNEVKTIKTNLECNFCKNIFNPKKGVSSRGYYECSHCGYRERIVDFIKRRNKPLNTYLFALQGYCRICGKFFKKADSYDHNVFKKAKAEYNKRKNTLLIPHQKIPVEGRSDKRPVNHGYVYFKDMFNERQLLCLGYLLKEITKIKDKNLREFFLIAFSDSLDANNMFCKFESKWDKISLFFGLHAYHPIERPTENNVWGTKYGRGSFIKCVEKLKKAKIYCEKPYERIIKKGKRISVFPKGEKISAQIVSDFKELKKRKGRAILKCQSSEDLSFIPDESVDLVITDPPYFDNVQYSELSDFFYVWLRLGLKDIYSFFKPEYSYRENEIVQNDRKNKNIEFFSESIKKVFRECKRVLKKEGLLVFTFHHTKLWAWESMGNVLLDSGFYVSHSVFVRSEGKSGFHSSEGNIKYDSILVCRKRPSNFKEHRWEMLKKQILIDSTKWIKRTLNSGMSMNEVDVFTVLMGKTLEYYTKAYPEVKESKNPVLLFDALHEINKLIKEAVKEIYKETKKEKEVYKEKVKQLVLFVKESKTNYRIE